MAFDWRFVNGQELARDHLDGTGNFNVISAIISPCSDGYVKKVGPYFKFS